MYKSLEAEVEERAKTRHSEKAEDRASTESGAISGRETATPRVTSSAHDNNSDESAAVGDLESSGFGVGLVSGSALYYGSLLPRRHHPELAPQRRP